MAIARNLEADPAETAPGRDIQRDFWLSHMRIGFGIFLGETLFVLVYLGLTPHGPHRGILKVVAVLWFVCASLNVLFAPRLASWHRRAQFSASWSILAAFGVAGVAGLDGGIGSPTILLLFLPAAFAALAFSPRVAGMCGLATLVSAVLVWVTEADRTTSVEAALVLFAVLSGSLVLSVAASVNRTRRENHERLLVERIAELATTDGLTGCVVHRAFYERLGAEIARSMRHGDPLSLMVIDVDAFKSVNDTYGHVVGDHVLAAIGKVLEAQARSSDVIGRMGGDEFAIVMPQTDARAAMALAGRIREAVPAATEVPVTLSIGVSGLDRSTPTTERMMDDADFALYEVKGAGRDGVAIRDTGSAVPERRPAIDRAPITS
ncbi:MAG TPA: diguanylate cyclase [Acidimicrobiales bacterium]|nr:diguanylate cyclase [Acidimicrobiales bacterium]